MVGYKSAFVCKSDKELDGPHATATDGETHKLQN